jgi:hypothetical protein
MIKITTPAITPKGNVQTETLAYRRRGTLPQAAFTGQMLDHIGPN